MTVKNGYIIGSEIDRGVQGIVFKAKSPGGALVVLKQMSLEEGRREYDFIRRIAAANGASLANVIRCIDAFESDGDFFLVLEALADSVGSLVNHKNVTPFALRSVAIGSIRGLAEIYRADIIHCDVKPDNFGVSRRSNRVVAFDLASAVTFGEKTRGYSEHTAPPEVLAGIPSKTSDTYGWARMIELQTTGMVRICPDNSIIDVVPWIGRAFADLLRRCAAESHHDRPDPVEAASLAKEALIKLEQRPGCQCLQFVDGEPFNCGH